MNKVVKRFLIVYIAFVLLVAFDIITKVVTDGIDIEIIKNVLSFSSVYNKGAAWSVFSDYTIILAIISLLFVIGAVIFDAKTKIYKTTLYNFAYVLILGGAFGNAIDRLFLGYVRDFIKLDFIDFPVFNVADSFLVIGVILLSIFIVTYKGNEGVKEDNNNGDSKQEPISEKDADTLVIDNKVKVDNDAKLENSDKTELESNNKIVKNEDTN